MAKLELREKKNEALAVFARAPVLATVKTRLARTLGDKLALQLYCAMLRDVMAACELWREIETSVWIAHQKFSLEHNTFVENVPTPRAVSALETEHRVLDGELRRDKIWELQNAETSFRAAADFWNGEIRAQIGGDLGAKLSDCFATLRDEGFARVVVIGSDAPDLPPQFLRDAFEKLRLCDLVFGPAEDGGFYLVGASCELPHNFFDDVKWSSDQTLRDVLRRAQRFKLVVGTLPVWRDVDDENDLRALYERLKNGESAAPNCHRVLDAFLAGK